MIINRRYYKKNNILLSFVKMILLFFKEVFKTFSKKQIR